VKQAAYRTGPTGRLKEQEEIKRMLDDDIVAPLSSEWASPV